MEQMKQFKDKVAIEFINTFNKFEPFPLGYVHWKPEGGINKEGVVNAAHASYYKLKNSKRISAKFKQRMKDLTRLLDRIMKGYDYDTPDGKPEKPYS